MKTNVKKRLAGLWLHACLLLPVSVFCQPVYTNVAVSSTACSPPCASGVVNPSYATDGNLQTYALLNNSLGVGSTVELVTGFSTPGGPGAMIVIPIKKAGSLLDATLLGQLSVDVLDASGNVIVQKTGVGLLDLEVLSATDQTSAITLFAPSAGSFQVSRIRIRLGGLASVQTSVYIGDAFYAQPSGGNCGIRYATTYSDGGTGVCVGCSVSNTALAADTDFTNYAQITVVVGLGATRYIELGWPTGGNAGDFVGIVMGSGGGLLDLSLLGNMTVTLYNGVTSVGSVTASSVLGASLLSGGSQRSLIGFNAPAAFTSIRLTVSAVLGLLNTVRIYGALTYDPTPAVISVTAASGGVICDGSSAQVTASAGFSTYAWSSGQTTQTIAPTVAGAYAVVGTDGGGCPFFSSPVNISVLPKPHTPNITTDPLYCLGGNARIVVDTGISTYTYQVYNVGTGLEVGQGTGTGGVLELFTLPVSTSASYRVQVTNTATGCTALTPVALAVTPPGTPGTLSAEGDRATCWVKPGNRYVHFMQPGTTRILASINPQTNDLGSVDVSSYVAGTPVDVQACNTQAPWFITTTLNRRWVVKPQTQPVAPVNMRMYFSTAELSALSDMSTANQNDNDDLYSITDMVLSKYSGLNEDGIFSNNCGNGSTLMFQSAGNGYATSQFASFYSGGRYIDFTIPSFSEFWLFGNSPPHVSPLPVVLVSFTAECAPQGASLRWNTVSEIGSAAFVVERSADMQNWETAATVQGAGNSNQPLSYEVLDPRPLPGPAYYRLVQKDFDGNSEIFAPVGLTCHAQETTGLAVYPNPAAERFTLQVTAPPQTTWTEMEMTDMNGRRVMTKKMAALQGLNESTIDIDGLSPGIYMIRVRSEGMSFPPARLMVK